MSSAVRLQYVAFLAGLTPAEAATIMGNVGLPRDVLNFLGVRLVDDGHVVPPANPVVRTILLGLNPLDDGFAQANALSGNSASPIASVTVTNTGFDYVQPPVVTFAGGRLAPPPTGGGVSMDSYSLNQPAQAFAYLKLNHAEPLAGGAGYSPDSFIRMVGRLRATTNDPNLYGKPEGTALPPGAMNIAADFPILPQLQPVFSAGGSLVGVNTLDPGRGLAEMPTAIVVDPQGTGSGAEIHLILELDEIRVTRGGAGFVSMPDVVLTPWFQHLFPLSDDPFIDVERQALPFRNLFTPIFEQALMSPVSALEPEILL